MTYGLFHGLIRWALGLLGVFLLARPHKVCYKVCFMLQQVYKL